MNVRQVRWGIAIFTALVVASVGVALAGLTWRLAGYGVDEPVAVSAPNRGPAAAGNLGPVLALAPFGTALATGESHGDGSIRLKAIFVAIPAAASSVLIAGSDGKVASYAIGSAVGGGIIDQIEPDQIMLRKAGTLQAIGFAASAGAPAPVAPVAIANTGPGGAHGIRLPMPTAAPSGLIPPGIMSSGHVPSGSPLAPVGYRVDSAAPPALMAAGLRTGDVVEQVNGTTVDAGTNARDLLAQAMQAGTAQVVINRAGQRIALNLAIH
jgi:general secretion pathway protein C